MKHGVVLSKDEVRNALEHLAENGVPAYGAAGLFDVGTSEFIRYIEEEIFDGLIANGGSTCRIFEGAYGTGKTHLLKLLQDSALQRGMAVVCTDLSQALDLKDWHLITRHILQNLQWESRRGLVRSLPSILEAFGRESTIKPAALSSGSLPHAGFARAMSLMLAPGVLSREGKPLLGRYLQGEKVSTTELADCAISGLKHPLSRRNAELVLKTVLTGLHQVGLPGTLLLFDENEKTFGFSRGQPPPRVVSGANLLRRLIDGSANGALVGTAIVFAVLQDFVDSCGRAYPALGQRLKRGAKFDRAAWRWPVLKIESVSTERDPQVFVRELVRRYEFVLSECGVQLNGNANAILESGMAALSKHAGSDRIRHVVKQVAFMSLEFLP